MPLASGRCVTDCTPGSERCLSAQSAKVSLTKGWDCRRVSRSKGTAASYVVRLVLASESSLYVLAAVLHQLLFALVARSSQEVRARLPLRISVFAGPNLWPGKRGILYFSTHEGDGARSCIAFQLAAFLKKIASSRHAILSQLQKDLEGDSQDPPLQSQGPMGRVSLDRQDFE